MTCTSDKISEKLLNVIKSFLSSSTSIPTIQNYIRLEYKKNISYHAIYNIQKTVIDEVLKQICNNPSASPVDKLIGLFNSYENVSFIYLIHKYDTGLITHRKGASNNQSNYNNSSTLNDVNKWRENLRISNNDNVLVAFP